MDELQEKLIEIIQKSVGGCSRYWVSVIADGLIKNGVEIPVRCKDCKHWKHIAHVGCSDLAKVCMLSNYMIGANGYCLYGERKTDE